MVAINELVQILEVMRAHGVLKLTTPELSIELGALPQPTGETEAGVAKERHDVDPRVESALKRLPPAYRDPRLWNLGDQA
jgi:hypothetical protein